MKTIKIAQAFLIHWKSLEAEEQALYEAGEATAKNMADNILKQEVFWKKLRHEHKLDASKSYLIDSDGNVTER